MEHQPPPSSSRPPWDPARSPVASQQPEPVAPEPMGQVPTRPVEPPPASEPAPRRSSYSGHVERTSGIEPRAPPRSSSLRRRSSGSRAASGPAHVRRSSSGAAPVVRHQPDDTTQHLLELLSQAEGDVQDAPDPDFILREAVPALGEENEGVNGHLRCSICLGLFVRPYTAAQGCGHTYCQTCLLRTFVAAAERMGIQAREEDQAFIDQEQHFMLAAPSSGIDSVGDGGRPPTAPLPPTGWSTNALTPQVLDAHESEGRSLGSERLRTLVSLSVPCPTCRAPLTLGDLVPAPSIVNHMVDSLHVLCPHRERGCPSTPERSELLAHMATCPHAPAREQSAPRAPAGSTPACPDCSEPLDGAPLSRHRRRYCVETEVGCPLCQQTGIPRRLLPAHLTSDCAFAPVQCLRAKFGCLWEGKRVLCPDGISTLTPAQIEEHVHASRPPKHDAHDHRKRDAAAQPSEQHPSVDPETGLLVPPAQMETDAGSPTPRPASDLSVPLSEIHVCPLAPLEGWLQARENEMDEMRAENALLRSSLSQVQNTLTRLEITSDRQAAALAPFLPPPCPPVSQSAGLASQSASLASLVDDLLAPSVVTRARSEATEDSAVVSQRTGSVAMGRSPTSGQQSGQPLSSPSHDEPSAPLPVPVVGSRASSTGHNSESIPRRDETLSASAPAAVDADIPPPPSAEWGTWAGRQAMWPPAGPGPTPSVTSIGHPDAAPRDLGQELAQLRSSIDALTRRLTLGETRTDHVLRLAQGTNAETVRLVEETSALGRSLGPLHMQMHQLMLQAQRPYAPIYMQRPSGVDTGPSAPGGPGPLPMGPAGPAMGPSVGPGTAIPPGGAVQFRRWTLLDGTKL